MNELKMVDKDVNDALAVQRELKKDTLASTPAQRKEMSAAVAAYMRGDVAAPEGAERKRNSTKELQNNKL